MMVIVPNRHCKSGIVYNNATNLTARVWVVIYGCDKPFAPMGAMTRFTHSILLDKRCNW